MNQTLIKDGLIWRIEHITHIVLLFFFGCRGWGWYTLTQ